MLKSPFLVSALTLNLFLSVVPYVWSHGDEPHGEPKAASPSDKGIEFPKKISISKLDQFKHQFRSLIISAEESPLLHTLPGKLTPSPQNYAKVQIGQPSRVVIDPQFPTPNPGANVELNQVVAVLEPLLSTGDLTTRKSELYKIEGEIETLKKQINRFTRLKDSVPKKDLENAQIEYNRAVKQRDQLLGTGLGREFLRAPIKGKISDHHLLPGQVVQPGQTVFEIINTQELRVEAYTFDYALISKVKQAYLKDPFKEEHLLPLKHLGVSSQIGEKDQTRHILFSLADVPAHVMIGMPVDVLIETTDTTKKIFVNHESLIKKGNTYAVAVFSDPEVLTQRLVEIGRIVNGKIEILSGLKQGEKILKDTSVIQKIMKKA